MSEQHEMYLPPAARTRDPATSKKAAKRIERTRLFAWEAVAKLVEQFPGCTCHELAERAKEINSPLSFETIHKRMKDAERHGLVLRAGERYCTVTGFLAIQNWPTTG